MLVRKEGFVGTISTSADSCCPESTSICKRCVKDVVKHSQGFGDAPAGIYEMVELGQPEHVTNEHVELTKVLVHQGAAGMTNGAP
jgi:hypothetical protein